MEQKYDQRLFVVDKSFPIKVAREQAMLEANKHYMFVYRVPKTDKYAVGTMLHHDLYYYFVLSAGLDKMSRLLN
jgi:hypothetical protein